MNKIKNFFSAVIQIIINPIRKIVSIPVPDRFVEFSNKHIWFRFLLSLIISVGIAVYYYYYKK